MNGMLTARPNRINPKWPPDAPAMARILSVDMVKSANNTYQMARAMTVRGGCNLLRLAGVAQHLEGDPQNEQAARQLDESNFENRGRDEGQPHAQNHRDRGAAHARDAPLARGQMAHGHRDHERVVAGQKQVDQDQRQAGDQEVAGWHIAFDRRKYRVAARASNRMRAFNSSGESNLRSSRKRARNSTVSRLWSPIGAWPSTPKRNVSIESCSLSPKVGR